MTKDRLINIVHTVQHFRDIIKNLPGKPKPEAICKTMLDNMERYRAMGEEDMALSAQVVYTMWKNNIKDMEMVFEKLFGMRSIPKSYHESMGYDIPHIEAKDRFAWMKKKQRRNILLNYE